MASGFSRNPLARCHERARGKSSMCGGVRKLRPCSWTHKEKSKVESCEHQDDANIHCQPFPEMVSEEHNIYTDYDGYHRHHVKHYSYLSAHFSQPSEKKRAPQRALVQWRKYQPPLSLRTATAHVSTQAIWRACTSKLAVIYWSPSATTTSIALAQSCRHRCIMPLAHDCATTWRKITKTM